MSLVKDVRTRYKNIQEFTTNDLAKPTVNAELSKWGMSLKNQLMEFQAEQLPKIDIMVLDKYTKVLKSAEVEKGCMYNL